MKKSCLALLLPLCLVVGQLFPVTATSQDEQISLHFAVAANRDTEHHHKIEFVQGSGEDRVVQIQEVRYKQKITEHEDGYLVSQSDFDIVRAEFAATPIKPSLAQRVILAMAIFTAYFSPDYIINDEAEFVRFVDADGISDAHESLIEKIVGIDYAELSKAFKFLSPLQNKLIYRTSIEKRLRQWKQWDGLTVRSDKPTAASIGAVSNSSNKNPENDQLQTGELILNGFVDCTIGDRESECVAVEFTSAATLESAGVKALTEVIFQHILEPDTLATHENVMTFRIKTDFGDMEYIFTSKILH